MVNKPEHDNVALRLRGISKTFGSSQVLHSVDLDIGKGEVMALLGANGSGKSTLIKVLAGFHAPDQGGEMHLGGQLVPLPILPPDSRKLGLSFVFQDLGLAPHLTVLENLMIGLRSAEGWRNRAHISWRHEQREAERILKSYGVGLDPKMAVADVAPVGRALLAIVRAAEVQRQFRSSGENDCSVLVLDEPTVFLPESDCEFLYELVRTVSLTGTSVIFVSHDLDAVRKVAHSVTVLRNGRVTGRAQAADVSEEELIDMIVGSERASKVPASKVPAAARNSPRVHDQVTQLEISGLCGGRVREVSFAVRPGEVLGLAGLLGSGVEELPYLLFGALRPSRGTARVGDTRIELNQLSPAAAMQAGIALVPSDRALYGGVGEISVEENMLLLDEDAYFRNGWRRRRAVRATTNLRCESFDVRPRRADIALGSLSGGNQQKVILAKWLELKPQVILLHEPTQGVDVGARADMYRLIRQAAETTGACVVWVTTEFAELAQVCDRVLIVKDGRTGRELLGADISRDVISREVFGSHDHRVSSAEPQPEQIFEKPLIVSEQGGIQ